MKLQYQNNILAGLAAIAVAVVILATRLSIIDVRNQADQVTMAENTVKAITNFRFLIMETTMYGEPRSTQQWRTRVGSFEKMLASQNYSEENENDLLKKEQANLKVLTRLYDRLSALTAGASSGASQRPSETANSTVGALFLTTEDMLDVAFELLRLNRIDLADAQDRVDQIIKWSIAVLMALILAGYIIIRRRVLAPVAALMEGTARVTAGDLGFRLNLNVGNEIGVLAATFDHMTAALERSQRETEANVESLAQKRAQIDRMRQELQTLIDQMPALVGSWDLNFRNRFGNRAYQSWFDISTEQMRGMHMREIIGAERFLELEPHLLSVLRGNPVVFEKTLIQPSGAKVHAVFSYVPELENGVVKGFYGFVSDVTPLKEAQLTEKKALAQLQGIVDAAQDFAIIAGDASGMIRLFSRGAEHMLGYAANDVVGQANVGMFHLHEEIVARGNQLTLEYGRPIHGIDAFTELARRGESESREWTYVAQDGARLPVNLTVTAIRDSMGTITGYLGIAKDITKDKEILRTLAETRDKAEAASLSKSQFLANMSHELRTPMNAILGMLQLLQLTELSAKQLDYAVKTQSAAQSLLGLLNDILDFSKIEADKLTLEHVPFSLDTLTRDLSVIFASGLGNKQIEVLFSISPELPKRLVGDPLRLRQVLINLVGNAIKFTERGEVVMSLEMGRVDGKCTEIVFSVSDTGIGITPEQMALVFEGFSQAEASTTRRFGGSGLGLAISQRLVKLMGGELAAESTWNIGSRFHFTLRFETAPDELGLDAPESRGTSVAGRQRALIVDDNHSARDYLLTMAASLGWQADSAADGATALTMLAHGALADQAYDVVFMDWKMPGMDGWETARRIRLLGQGGETPVVIMVTAFGREVLEERSQAERSLLNGLLVKPVTASMLRDALAESRQQPQRVAIQVRAQRLAGLRLLVVEDSLLNQQVAQELLGKEGALVELADRGGQGVEKALAAAPLYDAVLMDIQMPDMDGYQATREIRQHERLRKLPIIAMTANAMASDKAACLAAGMNDHLSKPIDIDLVVRTILHYCKPGAPKPAAFSPTAPGAETGPETIELAPALQRLGQNKPLFCALVQRFGDEVPAMMLEFRRHLSHGDSSQAAVVMHTLKGIAGTLGATYLARQAAAAERRLRAADMAIDSAALDALIGQARVALAAIAIDLQTGDA